MDFKFTIFSNLKKTLKHSNSETAAFVIIFIVFLIYTILLLLKVINNAAIIPEWDEPHHLLMGYHFYRALINQDYQKFIELLTNSQQIYPPLYHLLIALSYRLFGVSVNAGIFINILFTLIMMTMIYKLGGVIGSRKAGLISALLTPALPVFLALQERAIIDYASITVFIIMFWLLFKTEGFTQRRYSLYFGVFIFIGLLIKWPFLVPGIPFAFYGIKSFIFHKKNKKLIIGNIMLALLVASPALIWYVYNLKYIKEILYFFWNPEGFPQQIWSFPSGLTSENILKYLFYIPTREIGVGIVVLISFYWAIFFPKKNSLIKFLIASVAVTYVALTFLRDKSEFYIAYTYPLMMLITTMSLLNIKTKIFRYLFTGIFIGFISIHFILNQISTTTWWQPAFATRVLGITIFPKYFTKFSQEEWPTERFVQEQLSVNNCPNGILFFPDLRFFSYLTVQFYLATNNRYVDEIDAKRHYNPVKDKEFNTEFLHKHDCVVTKTGYPGVFANTDVMSFVNNYLNSSSDYRKEEYSAPDNSSLYVFIRTKKLK